MLSLRYTFQFHFINFKWNSVLWERSQLAYKGNCLSVCVLEGSGGEKKRRGGEGRGENGRGRGRERMEGESYIYLGEKLIVGL